MKKFLYPVLFALVLGTATASAQVYENPSVVGQVPDRVLVTVKAGTTLSLDKSTGTPSVGVASLDNLAARFAVTNMERLHADLTLTKLKAKMADKSAAVGLDRIWAIDFPAEMGLQKVLAAYEALPEVEEVHAVDICKQFGGYLPNDPGISGQQYYLRNMTLGGGDMRAVGGWSETLGDSNIVVCVLDSGVDWHHPDLGGDHPDKVNGAIWTNWTEYYGNPGQDDDGNGKIDDIRGWDFVNVNPSQGWPGQDVVGEDNDPMDFESHGTNCAGIVAAITDNGIGIAGTSPGSKIMAVRCGWLTNEGQGVVRMDFASSGMIYAAANDANIINCSWGSSSFLNSAVSAAQSAGCLVVTAAGNDNDDIAPYLGTRSGVMAVAASDGNDAKADFSNFGTWVEITAPGVAMYTTAYVFDSDTSTYGSVQGTSFSSPAVCGAAALIWSAHPTWNWQTIHSALVSSADNIDEENPGFIGQLGAGRVNLQRALGDEIQQYPAEYPTIFDAINCSSAGDTVKVESGSILNEVVTIDDRGIKFFGAYDSGYVTRDPAGDPTVITGNLSNAVLRFQGDVGTDTEVDGFRITGGGGLTFGGIPYFARYGGGIILNGHSPTLRNLDVSGNSVGDGSTLGCGGGIMITNCSPVLENVSVTGNTGIYGAGVFIFDATPTLTGCDISDNTVFTGNASNPPLGGGVHILDSVVDMTDCTVSGHLECQDGGGIFAGGHNSSSTLNMTGGTVAGNTAGVNGAGVYITGGVLDMRGVALDANLRTATASFMHGGGLFATAATVTLDSLTVTGNSAHIGAGVDVTTCTSAVVTNSVFTGNAALFWGGGLNYEGNIAGSIDGNTFFGNDGTAGGGGIYLNTSSPAISNNISAFNTGGVAYGNGMALISEPSSISCNDVFGNDNDDYSGQPDPTGTNGNISVDPLFCNSAEGNLNLTDASPCAPANSGACGLIGALTSGCGVSPVHDGEDSVPMAFQVEQNYPNPFNPSTTIKFALPSAGPTQVTIFDVAGHHVKTLLDEDLPAQTHQVIWTGDDERGRSVAAGVYFYMVTSGDERSVGRMALVK